MAIKETVVLSIESDGSKAEGSVKSLKAQLREAQAEVGKMADKFGETSTQAIQAAKKAAELKDRIGDAKALTDAFNPDKKFSAFSSALQGVVGGFTAVQGAMGLVGAESENVEKMMLKVQSAMALSQGLSAVTESIDAFKILAGRIADLSVVQKISAAAQRLWNLAMSANPIGAIIVAITALIAGIVALVKYLKSSSDAAEAQAAAVKKASKAIDDQKRSIESANEVMDRKQKHDLAMAKASGMSAEAIRKLERKLIDEKIATAEATNVTALNTVEKEKNRLASLKQADADDEVIKAQEENVKKAREILKATGDDVRKAGNERLDMINRHQEEVRQAETDANKKRNEDSKKSSEERKNKAKEEAKAILDATKQLHEETKKINEENFINSIKDERARAEAKLNLDYTNKIREITSSKASAEEKAQALLANETKYNLDLQALKDKNAKEDEKKAKEEAEKLIKAEKETFDLVTQARLAQIKDANVKRQEEEALRYQTDIDNLYNALNNKEITEADFNARREAVKTLHEQKLTDIDKINADERKKIAEAEAQAKITAYQNIGSAMNQLSDIVGKNTSIGKALGLASIAIDSGIAIAGIVKQATKNPTNLTPFQLFADIAARTVAVIANIKKAKDLINSAKVPGGGGGGMPSISATAPIAPQMSQTALNQQLVNQTGNAATRAFVLESDVSGNQERIRRLNRAARIN